MPPLCFILLPYGTQPLATGATVDFDAVFDQIVAPAITAAGLEPLRAAPDAPPIATFERLILCDYAVADLTGANANVFYELGLRHGIRPATTVLISADTGRLPFDVGPLRALPYGLAGSAPADPAGDGAKLTALLEAAKRQRGEPPTDSPVFQLVEGYAPPDIARLKTDVFRERAAYANAARAQLAAARRAGADAVRAAAASLGDIARQEAGVVIDLYLSLRAVKDWQGMVDLVARMPAPLARSPMVQEQLGFALNRLGRADEAEATLRAVIQQYGPSSETNGLLGRVYKDRWEAEARAASPAAPGWLKKAIATYLQGFEADWRDAYPGVNAVTLMELQPTRDPRQAELLPVVAYAVKRRIAQGTPDYWDHATLLELAVLAHDQAAAETALADALAHVREPWEPETTARNLKLIREAREQRGEPMEDWARGVEQALQS